MLETRAVTALLAAGLLLAALFFLPLLPLAALIGAVMLRGAWEWAALCGGSAGARPGVFLLVTGLAGAALLAWPAAWPGLLGGLAVWWLAQAVWLGSVARGAGPLPRLGAWRGPLVLAGAWLAAVALLAADPRRPWLLLSGLLIVWAADTGAYFAGRSLGGARLAPRLSPGKTVSGLVGGLLAGLAAGLVLGVVTWHLSGRVLLGWLALAVVVTGVSVAGDMHESLLKRRAGVKDSGRWLPGHGGILDRIDSLLAALPVYYAGGLLGLWPDLVPHPLA